MATLERLHLSSSRPPRQLRFRASLDLAEEQRLLRRPDSRDPTTFQNLELLLCGLEMSLQTLVVLGTLG